MNTPPFGLNLFLDTGITKSTFEEVVKGVWPFTWVSLIVMLIIMYVPEISIWLPNKL
ncbi:TRAP transporter large permease subunit [Chloroflexota bacterium]